MTKQKKAKINWAKLAREHNKRLNVMFVEAIKAVYEPLYGDKWAKVASDAAKRYRSMIRQLADNNMLPYNGELPHKDGKARGKE